MNIKSLRQLLEQDRPDLEVHESDLGLYIRDVVSNTEFILEFDQAAQERASKAISEVTTMNREALGSEAPDHGLYITRLESLIDTFMGSQARLWVNENGAWTIEQLSE